MEMKLSPGAISSLALELCLPGHFKLQSLLQKVCLACLVCFSVDGKLTQGGWGSPCVATDPSQTTVKPYHMPDTMLGAGVG